jgi:hypothetical protein
MNATLRRTSAVALVSLTAITLAGCGSSKDESGGTTQPVTTSMTTDNPSADSAVDQINEPEIPDVYVDLKASLAAFDQYGSQLPADVQSEYTKLKADIDHAEGLTGDDAAAAYATVKDDVDTIHDQITQLGDGAPAGVVAAWNTVKTTFDGIDASF